VKANWEGLGQAKTGESGEQTASKGETRGAKRSQQQKPSTPATAKRLNHQEQSILKTAPLTAVLSSPFDNHMIHVIAGQIFQKLCLEAALLGIRCLPLNQLIEVTESRAAVADLFPAMKGEPLVVFAMGYGEEETEKDWTPRLPFEQVLH
jgi:nitroreductase